MGAYLTISKGTEMLRVPLDQLMYIESDGNYSYVVTRDGRRAMVTCQLGQIEDMLNRQFNDSVMEEIVRLGRGLIVNCRYVYLIDTAKQKLVLSDCMGSYYELTASKTVLVQLKALMENGNDEEDR